MNTAYLEGKSLHRLELFGAVALVVAIFAGVFMIGDSGSLAGYVCILLASAAPAALWMKRGAVGLPILPIIGLIYFFYYGVPIIAGTIEHYNPDEILKASLTVCLFLAAMTLCWSAFAFRRMPHAFERDHALKVDFALPRLIFCALLFGLIFEIGSKADVWLSLGSWLGTFRSLAIASMSVGCFLFGTALGRGRLKVFDRYAGYALVLALMVIEISGLIMHMAIVLAAALLIGYVISSKRIPWMTMAAVMFLAGFLHAAENVERERYWTVGGDRQTIAISQIPDLMTEWFSAGLDQAVLPRRENSQNLAARASQMNMLLLVEEQTPRNIDFLGGTTYANFLRMVLPRFLVPDKISSQENLNLMSVRYGLQRAEDTEETTIAWNLVPEGYVNFGYTGVALAGLAFGLVVGLVTWFTSAAPPISLRGLMGLSALVTLLDVEYDFSYLMLNLLQALFSISLFYLGIKALEFFLGSKVLDGPPSGFHRAGHGARRFHEI